MKFPFCCIVVAVLIGVPEMRLWGRASLAHDVGPGSAQEVLREQRVVAVGNVKEQWRLVWRSNPQPACTPDDGLHAVWMTCPCAGFAFGERGDLELVRAAGSLKEDRLSLTRFFETEIGDWGQTAILPRWDVRDGDLRRADKEESTLQTARIHRRPALRIINLRDFDHDGRATEFFVQVAAAPCGKRMGIAVGVSRDRPYLHAFGSALHPDDPLVLRADHWEALARSPGPTTGIDWRCGDHGTSTQEELTLSADAKGIHVTRLFYDCTAHDTRGRLLRAEAQ